MLMRTDDSPSVDAPYPVYGGLFREEAIMLLRRFYVQENDKGKSVEHVYIFLADAAMYSTNAAAQEAQGTQDGHSSHHGKAAVTD